MLLVPFAIRAYYACVRPTTTFYYILFKLKENSSGGSIVRIQSIHLFTAVLSFEYCLYAQQHSSRSSENKNNMVCTTPNRLSEWSSVTERTGPLTADDD